jgi:hypothetical protein
VVLAECEPSPTLSARPYRLWLTIRRPISARLTVLKHQAAEAEEKLTRLYRAIEKGLADLDDSNIKGRIAELKRIRDSAGAYVSAWKAGRPGAPPSPLKRTTTSLKWRGRGCEGKAAPSAGATFRVS